MRKTVRTMSSATLCAYPCVGMKCLQQISAVCQVEGSIVFMCICIRMLVSFCVVSILLVWVLHASSEACVVFNHYVAANDIWKICFVLVSFFQILKHSLCLGICMHVCLLWCMFLCVFRSSADLATFCIWRVFYRSIHICSHSGVKNICKICNELSMIFILFFNFRNLILLPFFFYFFFLLIILFFCLFFFLVSFLSYFSSSASSSSYNSSSSSYSSSFVCLFLLLLLLLLLVHLWVPCTREKQDMSDAEMTLSVGGL